MFLAESTFTQVIKNTPLISIDLIVRNENNAVLLGLRNNRPALDHWFVPGGRIYKNESLADAFKRLTIAEIGLEFSISKVDFIGVYEHLYEDSVFDASISTHYVVLAYSLSVNTNNLNLPCNQHRCYQWFKEADLIDDNQVHLNTKNYFTGQGKRGKP